jgi:hypothetical protein
LDGLLERLLVCLNLSGAGGLRRRGGVAALRASWLLSWVSTLLGLRRIATLLLRGSAVLLTLRRRCAITALLSLRRLALREIHVSERLQKAYENQRNTMSQRCHEHIQTVRHHIAVVAIHTGVGFDHTQVEIGRKEFVEQNRMEVGFVRRMKVDSGQREPGSDQKAQEIVEVDRRVQETVEAGRIGFGHTAAAVLGEVVEEACCSLERQAGRMVSGMIEDIAEMGREGLAIGHREQEKNKRHCSAVLVPEVATGRASWQTVAVAVEAGERHSPRRQDMLDSPTCFQRRVLQS